MKKLGLIGGIGPESTIKYYRLIIEYFQKEFNTKDYPEIHIESINMTEMLSYAFQNNLDELADFLSQRIYHLEKAGVDFVAMASNTPHLVFDKLAEKAQLPLISIVGETCKAIQKAGINKVGLFGTKSTMTAGFYQQKAKEYDIEIIIPEGDNLDFVHDRYMNELVYNKIVPKTKAHLINVVSQLKEKNSIKGIILGGTELSLILEQKDFSEMTVFDTTIIHVESLVRQMA